VSETHQWFAELQTWATIVWRQPILGHFFGYCLFGLEKKVTRRPAGTGEIKFLLLIYSFRHEERHLTIPAL
jgi:hypothetical protein